MPPESPAEPKRDAAVAPRPGAWAVELPPPGRIVRVLIAIAVLLAVASVASQFYLLYNGYGAPFAKTMFRFDVDDEGTIPAWFSSLLLLFCGLMLAVITRTVRRQGGRFAWRWALLTLIFIGLSIDEACQFHEIIADRIGSRIETGGIFYFLWVWVAMPVVLLVGLFYLKMVLSLPRRIGAMFTIAGLMYLGGALGVEAFSGWVVDHYSVDSAVYILTATTEECLEMAGSILFLYALMRYRLILRSPAQARS